MISSNAFLTLVTFCPSFLSVAAVESRVVRGNSSSGGEIVVLVVRGNSRSGGHPLSRGSPLYPP